MLFHSRPSWHGKEVLAVAFCPVASTKWNDLLTCHGHMKGQVQRYDRLMPLHRRDSWKRLMLLCVLCALYWLHCILSMRQWKRCCR